MILLSSTSLLLTSPSFSSLRLMISSRRSSLSRSILVSLQSISKFDVQQTSLNSNCPIKGCSCQPDDTYCSGASFSPFSTVSEAVGSSH
ncbi:hypothetical protein F5882DRAFT_185328 [Hyaloscypha sp. PMI_1271]|nr:hypothetical protein F5882DRAFT_185328 [Hyaloscypha sp. PMI_1271]